MELQLSQTTQEYSDRTSLEDFMDYWTLISTQCLYVGLLPAGARSAPGWYYRYCLVQQAVSTLFMTLFCGCGVKVML